MNAQARTLTIDGWRLPPTIWAACGLWVPLCATSSSESQSLGKADTPELGANANVPTHRGRNTSLLNLLESRRLRPHTRYNVLPFDAFRERLVRVIQESPANRKRASVGGIRLLEETYLAFSAALAATDVRYVIFRKPKKNASKHPCGEASHLQSFCRRLLLEFIARGQYAFMKGFKRSLAALREQVFTGRCTDRRLVRFCTYYTSEMSREKRDDFFLQISNCNRALPVGDRRVVAEALSAHKEELSCRGHSPKAVIDAARAWASDWAIKNKLAIDLSGLPPVKASACLTHSSRRGGLVTALLELLTPGPKTCFNRCPHIVPEDQTSALILAPSSIVHHQSEAGGSSSVLGRLRMAFDRPGSDFARVVALPERGYKARIVTCHDAPRLGYLHLAARGFREALQRDNRVRDVMKGDHRGAVEGLFRHGCDPRTRVVSADLTAASDTLHSDLLGAIVEGCLSTVQGLSKPDLERIHRGSTGAYWLMYPDRSIIETKRGALMGLPMTWPLLCLAHLFWCDRSAVVSRTIRPKYSIKHSSDSSAEKGGIKKDFAIDPIFSQDHRAIEYPDPRVKGKFGTNGQGVILPYRLTVEPLNQREVICGDDLAAVWSEVRIEQYEALASVSGAKFSSGKHLISNDYGIFTEEIFSVTHDMTIVQGPNYQAHAVYRGKWEKGLAISGLRDAIRFKYKRLPEDLRDDAFDVELPHPVSRFKKVERRFGRWCRCIPLKWAVSCSVQGQRGKFPQWFAIGAASYSVLGHFPWAAPRIERVWRQTCPEAPRELAKIGLPPYLPRELGGGGLVLRTGLGTKVGHVCSKIFRRGLGGLLYRSKNPRGLAQIFQSAMSPAYARAYKEAEQVIKRTDVWIRRAPLPFPVEMGEHARHPTPKLRKLGNVDDMLERRAGSGSLWAVIKKREVLTQVSMTRVYALRAALHKALKTAARKGGQLSSSAPVGALLKRMNSIRDERLVVTSLPLRQQVRVLKAKGEVTNSYTYLPPGTQPARLRPEWRNDFWRSRVSGENEAPVLLEYPSHTPFELACDLLYSPDNDVDLDGARTTVLGKFPWSRLVLDRHLLRLLELCPDDDAMTDPNLCDMDFVVSIGVQEHIAGGRINPLVGRFLHYVRTLIQLNARSPYPRNEDSLPRETRGVRSRRERKDMRSIVRFNRTEGHMRMPAEPAECDLADRTSRVGDRAATPRPDQNWSQRGSS